MADLKGAHSADELAGEMAVPLVASRVALLADAKAVPLVGA